MSGNIKYYYLFRFQYLGFRFHGWQKQINAKTIQGELEKAIKNVLPVAFRIISAGRTDSMVSANDSAFELFTKEHIELENLVEKINFFLPPDIRVLSVEQTDATFNIIQSAKQKEYVYLFSFGSRNHPFSAPFITAFHENLDLDLMMKGTKLFVGEHNFRFFTKSPKEGTQVVRVIDACFIQDNKVLSANFFPEKSYALHVRGAGFIRYQIRFIMGALVCLGLHQISLNELSLALSGEGEKSVGFIAPASGLLLNEVRFN